MTAPALLRSESEVIAAGLREKGERWKAREWTISLREDSPAAEGAAPADTRIPVRLSSEAPVERYDWWNDQSYTEILDHSAVDLSYARDGLPFCLDHWTSKQIGLVEDVRVEGDEVVGMVRFGAHPDAAWVEQDIRSGIRKKVSIGYVQGEYTVVGKVKPGEPEIRRYAFALLEGSSVCIPADYEVGFGRSYLRALRPLNNVRPETAPMGQESTMTAPAAAAPDTGAAGRSADEHVEDAAAETLRIGRLRSLVDSQDADPADVLRWITEKVSVKDALKELGDEVTARNAASPARNVRTGAALDVFVRSGKGPIGRDGKVKDGESGGFDSPGEFFRAVALHARKIETDPRLSTRGVATGQSEGLESDGGALLPPQFETDLSGSKYEPGSILDRVRHMTLTSNSLKISVVDETSRANGSRSGAVVAAWGDEADSYNTLGKIKFRKHEIDLHKLIARAAVTEEQSEDIPALTSMLPNEFRKEVIFMQEDGIMNGTGNGQPVGLISTATGTPTVKQAVEGGQTIANTPASLVANLSKMYSRMVPSLISGAVWLMNIDFLPYLIQTTLGGTSAAMPVYLPGGNIAGAPFGTILGRPVLFTEYNAAVGTPGDIVFVNLNEYLLAEKASGLGVQTSTHVYFNTGETAFRFMKRVDGAPLWKSAITPYKGSNTKSYAVILDTRS